MMDNYKCVKCGEVDDNLTNFLCDDCWDKKYISINHGIPILDDDKLSESIE